MSRRQLAVTVLVVLACLGGTSARAADGPGAGSTAAVALWDPKEIATVVAGGLMGPSVLAFRPQDPITWGELAEALSNWGRPINPPPDPTKPVTIRQLDARLVASLQLQPASRAVRRAARNAGLSPIPSRGTETVARMLGLRLNHPAGQDRLELLPSQPATRAEAAYSIAHAVAVSDWQRQQVLDATRGLAFPSLTNWQRLVLTRALRFVGYPYVWTGTSEKPTQTLWDGSVVPGGFDCSGFVWRVYKLQPFPNEGSLSQVLQGRTTYAMSGEVAVPARIGRADLQPADVVFFGTRGTSSKPADIGHAGIYVGNGWFVHSSERGVALTQMSGWYENRFAWGRRPLAEAGLEGPGAVPLAAPLT